MSEAGVLLDTHVWIWLNNGSPLLETKHIDLINQFAKTGKVFISAISVWELATLVSKNRITLRISLRDWVEDALSQPGISMIPLTPDISIESAQLPEGMHGDPADRLIVASSRLKRTCLLTRDSKILNYAKNGFVSAMEI